MEPKATLVENKAGKVDAMSRMLVHTSPAALMNQVCFVNVESL